MAQLLDFLLNKNARRCSDQYPDHESLFLGFSNEESAAIRCLESTVSGYIVRLGYKYRLANEDIEELICDSISLCLLKIKQGKYVFQGHALSSYVIEIAGKKALNIKTRLQKDRAFINQSEKELAYEPDYTDKVAAEKLEALLAQLDENCRNLVTLKYLDGIRDKEVIEKKLTQYTTVDALKNHRSKCMKKLSDLARKSKKP